MPEIDTSISDWSTNPMRAIHAVFDRLRHAAVLDFGPGIDAGQVRARQLRELITLTPWMMAANIGNAAIIVVFLSQGLEDWPLMLWGACILSVGCVTIGKARAIAKRPPIQTASARAVGRAIRHAAILGAIWAVLPVLILPQGNVVDQVLTTNVIAGMSAGGAFALAVIPFAAAAYLTAMLVPCLLAIVAGYIPASAPLFFLGVIYLVTLAVTILARYRVFSLGIRDRFRIERQNETIGILLKDFEASASDWLWETDREGRLSYVSARLAEVSARTRHDLVGKPIAETAGESRTSTEWATLATTISAGTGFRDVIVPALHAGKPSWWSLTAGPTRDGSGRITGYRGVGTDVTQRRTAELALAAQNQTLASFNAKLEIEVAARTREAEQSAAAAIEASTAKSTFLANMSHEIRTPMNGVFGMTDLLKRTSLDAHQQRLVATISQSAKSLLTIINDILDISRIEAGKMEIDRQPFDLRGCVEEAVELFAEAAARKGLNLTLYVDPKAPAILSGDKGRLRQICVNLIGNAIKFTPCGDVSIRVVADHIDASCARLAFHFADTGIGIAAPMQDKLFAPFVQADSSISRRFGGTGLGLSISRYLVDMMGGKIAVASAPGEGTKLTFSLDFDIGQDARAEGRIAQSLPKGTRVLVVDDRPVNREILAAYLKAAGADVVEVTSGKEGLAALEDAVRSGTPFPVAVVDVMMPDMDGLQFLEAIRAEERFAGMQTVMATSMNWAGDIGEVRRLGAHALLTKPVREADLIAAAAAAFDGSQVRRIGSEDEKTPRGWSVSLPLGARVLVAEDNPVNIEVAKDYLEGLGCAVRVAENGHEAVSAVQAQAFDVILMDCQMPGMDGLEATRRIRAREREMDLPRIPILALTANAYESDRQACLAAGMDDYLSKPFTEADLVAILGRWYPRRNAPVSKAA